MENISVTELRQRLAAGEKVNLVDVREPYENKEFNIGGILLPLGQIHNMQTDGIDNLKDEEVVCYCRSGNRSQQACLFLEMLGFRHVRNLTGGMVEWQRSS